MFFDVGTLHPEVSLLWEVGRSANGVVGGLHCTLFWLKVLSSKVFDGRL